MAVPDKPKIYHITHVDRLPAIIGDGHLYCDAEITKRGPWGPTVGIEGIKYRRLFARLNSHPGLTVGKCVPFYFCPRSVMLYLIYRGNNPHLSYHGGQGPIIHLEADLRLAVDWAEQHRLRWAFTLSNAGASYFEDRSNLEGLKELNWEAITANIWSGAGVSPFVKEGKQAEFLVEQCFPWHLIERIGVNHMGTAQTVFNSLPNPGHRPRIERIPNWYY